MLLTIDKKRAVLATRMSPALMGIVPRLEGHRKWLKEGGLRLEPSQYNIELLRDNLPSLEVKYVGEQPGVQENLDEDSWRVVPYLPKTAPYDHQDRAAAKMDIQRCFALFMEQGTGKTKVAIDRAGRLHADKKITGVLVCAPKGVHRQWVDGELPIHYGGQYSAAFWPLKEFPKTLSPQTDLKWLTINIDAIKTPKGHAMCDEFITAHAGRVLMVIDESHTIKNARSARWRAANDLGRRVTHRMIMTGTPIAKDLSEEWAQLKWLDDRIIGIRYMNAFRNEYCIMGGFEGRAVVGHKNIERFKERVAPFTFRATKDEIGILPKAYARWTFDLTPQQKMMIRTMRRELMVQLEGGELATANNAAVAVMRLQQIANGFVVDEDGVLRRIFPDVNKNPRINALKEYLLANPGKTVIWARFREDITQIEELLGGDCVTYHGGTNDKDRISAIQSFLTVGGGAQYFVSNAAAGGTGLNLQGECNRALYYSNSDNSIERWQSEDRIHRIGTLGAVVYTDLVAPGSTDAKMLNNLRRKKATSEMALGDVDSSQHNWEEDFREFLQQDEE